MERWLLYASIPLAREEFCLGISMVLLILGIHTRMGRMTKRWSVFPLRIAFLLKVWKFFLIVQNYFASLSQQTSASTQRASYSITCAFQGKGITHPYDDPQEHSNDFYNAVYPREL